MVERSTEWTYWWALTGVLLFINYDVIVGMFPAAYVEELQANV